MTSEKLRHDFLLKRVEYLEDKIKALGIADSRKNEELINLYLSAVTVVS